MALIYQNDQTKLWELEMGIPQYTGLEFTREQNRIETTLPIKTSGTFYTQLVFTTNSISLEVTIHETTRLKNTLLGGDDSLHQFSQNFDNLYRYGVKIEVVSEVRQNFILPEMYEDEKIFSWRIRDLHTVRVTSDWMDSPSTEWGIINLCTGMLSQIPGYTLPKHPATPPLKNMQSTLTPVAA